MLRSIIAALMEIPEHEVDDDSGLATVETWDSMRELMLASRLEQEYDIELTIADLEMLHCVRDIRTVLARHGVNDP